MNFLAWEIEIEHALVVALRKSLATIQNQPIQRLDVGIFPWHGQIELSLLRQADIENNLCEQVDIAAWPLYNIACVSEGHWPEADNACKQMLRTWQENPNTAGRFFESVSAVLAVDSVAQIIGRFSLTSTFHITVFNPDKPNFNYYDQAVGT